MLLRSFILATSALVFSGTAPAAAQDKTPMPYSADEGEFITLSGRVNSIDGSTFSLDYDFGTIKVEFEDKSWFFDASNRVSVGDNVTVYGTADDEFLGGRVIEAQSVIAEDQYTIYTDDYSIPVTYYVRSADIENLKNRMSIEGRIQSVDGREAMLDTGNVTVRIDTATLGYNPFDDEGMQQIDKGDRVVAIGTVDENFFERNEFRTTAIYLSGEREGDRMNSDSAQRDAAYDTDEGAETYKKNAAIPPNSEFAQLDVNGDGIVTQAEYVTKAADAANISEYEAALLFEAISEDDEQLTRSEFLTVNNNHEEIFEWAVSSY